MMYFRSFLSYSSRFSSIYNTKIINQLNFVKLPCNNQVYSPILMIIHGKKTITENLNLPNPPKRPPSSYIIFSNENLNKYLHLNGQERMKCLQQDWKQLAEPERKKYNLIARANMDAYIVQYKDYKSSLTQEQRQELQKLRSIRRQEKRERKVNLKYKKELEQFKKPKHPGTAIAVFTRKIATLEKGLKIIDFVERWRDLSPETKDSYKKEASDLYKKYKQDLAIWTERMRQANKEHLIGKKFQK